jgi:hypothetical protein
MSQNDSTPKITQDDIEFGVPSAKTQTIDNDSSTVHIVINTGDYIKSKEVKEPDNVAGNESFNPVKSSNEKTLLTPSSPTPAHMKNAMVTADRSGSAANIIRNQDGSITTVRRNASNAEILVAVNRKLSQGSQPNIFASGVATPKEIDSDPILSVSDVIERTAGQGDFYEHLWPLESLSENYQCRLNIKNIKESQGLTEERAKNLIEDYGPNVLTPPPRVPLWLLFLMQFTNLLMILLMLTACLTLILYGVQPSNPTNLYLGVLLWIVVILTCYETFSVEAKSGKRYSQYILLKIACRFIKYYLYYIISYYIILYYIITYYILSYYNILYYVILYHIM